MCFSACPAEPGTQALLYATSVGLASEASYPESRGGLGCRSIPFSSITPSQAGASQGFTFLHVNSASELLNVGAGVGCG